MLYGLSLEDRSRFEVREFLFFLNSLQVIGKTMHLFPFAHPGEEFVECLARLLQVGYLLPGLFRNRNILYGCVTHADPLQQYTDCTSCT